LIIAIAIAILEQQLVSITTFEQQLVLITIFAQLVLIANYKQLIFAIIFK